MIDLGSVWLGSAILCLLFMSIGIILDKRRKNHYNSYESRKRVTCPKKADKQIMKTIERW